jgi:hypothetical protein
MTYAEAEQLVAKPIKVPKILDAAAVADWVVSCLGNPGMSTKTLAFNVPELRSLAPRLSFDAVIEFSSQSFPSLHTDTDQERCHFSSPTKRQIIIVGVGGTKC